MSPTPGWSQPGALDRGIRGGSCTFAVNLSASEMNLAGFFKAGETASLLCPS